jgi:hypothetical protein
MLRRVALVRTDVSEENIASISRVTTIGQVGILAVTSDRSTPIIVTQIMKMTGSSETLVLTRVTRRNISEYCILYV